MTEKVSYVAVQVPLNSVGEFAQRVGTLPELAPDARFHLGFAAVAASEMSQVQSDGPTSLSAANMVGAMVCSVRGEGEIDSQFIPLPDQPVAAHDALADRLDVLRTLIGPNPMKDETPGL